MRQVGVFLAASVGAVVVLSLVTNAGSPDWSDDEAKLERAGCPSAQDLGDTLVVMTERPTDGRCDRAIGEVLLDRGIPFPGGPGVSRGDDYQVHVVEAGTGNRVTFSER